MKVYVDLDGVLADFDNFGLETFGPDWRKEVEKDNWGAFSEIQDLYMQLNPLHDAQVLWDYLHSTFPHSDVQILTAIPKRAYFPEAVNDKRDWVHKHFSNKTRVNFGPYAYDKQFHCLPGDILIDDMVRNIDQWNMVGGIGIVHTSAEATIAELKKVLQK